MNFQGKDDSARFSSRRKSERFPNMRFIIKPPPDAWIFTLGVDAPIFLSDLCSVCHAWTLPMVLLRGWGYEASQKENDGESGCDDVGLGRALSRKAGSVSAKAETSECKEHPWCDITVAPCAAHASLLSRLRTSERVWQCFCRNHSCGGGGRRGGRPTPEIRF